MQDRRVLFYVGAFLMFAAFVIAVVVVIHIPQH